MEQEDIRATLWRVNIDVQGVGAEPITGESIRKAIDKLYREEIAHRKGCPALTGGQCNC